MKKMLITGANSYIGTSFERYMEQYDDYQIDTLDMMNPEWKNHDFSKYDVVFHVAGIAHADVGHVSEETKQLYYKVNRDLTIETCQKAKNEGVKQFIFMSSMIVYSGCKTTLITKETKPRAENFYGDSKLQADLAIQELSDDTFKVCIIRPPMIYGKGSKGNYAMLVKLATKLPLFPIVKNQRSMLYIENLCEFIRLMVENEESGVFFPQNSEYINTSEMVKMISMVKGNHILMIPGTHLLIKLLTKLPGKIGKLSNKAFGNSVYDKKMSIYKDPYSKYNLNESIRKTESKQSEDIYTKNKKKILLIALPGYSKGIKDKMINLGYEVVHINDKPNDGVICKTFGRLKIPAYVKVIEKYYEDILSQYENKNFDYVVAIRGEYTPINTLKYISKIFPNAKKILYMWDSLINNKGIEKKWSYYDTVYTFDRIDYLNNRERIKFLPLYYYEDYIPKDKTIEKTDYKYDIAFIGTGHGDRVKIAKQVEKQCQELGLTCYMYIFLPHKLIYLKNKLFNRDYKKVSIKDIHFQMLSLEKSYQIYHNAKCIMDIESKTQNGLTMRTIEMVGLKKKLITTNKDIMNYDIYENENIMVSDRSNFIIDPKFINKEYKQLNEEIYIKYSLSQWIKELLGDEKK